MNFILCITAVECCFDRNRLKQQCQNSVTRAACNFNIILFACVRQRVSGIAHCLYQDKSRVQDVFLRLVIFSDCNMAPCQHYGFIIISLFVEIETHVDWSSVEMRHNIILYSRNSVVIIVYSPIIMYYLKIRTDSNMI